MAVRRPRLGARVLLVSGLCGDDGDRCVLAPLTPIYQSALATEMVGLLFLPLTAVLLAVTVAWLPSRARHLAGAARAMRLLAAALVVLSVVELLPGAAWVLLHAFAE